MCEGEGQRAMERVSKPVHMCGGGGWVKGGFTAGKTGFNVGFGAKRTNDGFTREGAGL